MVVLFVELADARNNYHRLLILMAMDVVVMIASTAIIVTLAILTIV